ncbi:MAG: 3-oxoacyl-[acyl-carrier-protein] reductase [Thiotrichales bacterium]|nr:MAG: 3-oxoacyl-[acyl-carrier-protein] reductase [Thiotrichales bacterium]
MTTIVRNVLITGASRGIGFAIMESLAKQGHYIMGTATGERGLVAINKYLSANKFAGKAIQLNLSSKNSIDDLITELQTSNCVPDIFVNNAGIVRDNLLMRMSDDEWNQVVEINLNAVFKLSKAFVRPMMKKRWGRMIFVSSIVGLMGNAGQTNYCASKAGLIGFGKALAREVSTRGITVNMIAPGFINTDMTNSLKEEYKQLLEQHIPMKRVGNPAEVAAVAEFLASEGASYITGETINVNGGMYM